MNTSINFHGFIDPYQDESRLQTVSAKNTTSDARYMPAYTPFVPYDPTPDVEALREIIQRIRGK